MKEWAPLEEYARDSFGITFRFDGAPMRLSYRSHLDYDISVNLLLYYVQPTVMIRNPKFDFPTI